MIDGNVNEFVDILSRGGELWFLFKGVKYFFQGWYEANGMHVFVVEAENLPDGQKYFWRKSSMKIEECAKAFFDAPIWDGKTFWEAEHEMTWVG